MDQASGDRVTSGVAGEGQTKVISTVPDPPRKLFRPWEKALIAMLATAFVTLVAFSYYRVWESVTYSELQEQSNAAIQKLTNRFREAESALVSVTGLAQGNELLSTTELTAMGQALVTEYPQIEYLMQLYWVRAPERIEFEEDMQRGGFIDFVIHDSISGGVRNTAPQRSQYLVISFVEPFTPQTAGLIGLDLFSLPQVAAALLNAVDLGRVDGAYLNFFPTSGHRYLFIKPTFFGHYAPTTAAERRTQLSGALVTLVDLDRVLASLSSHYEFLDISIAPTETSTDLAGEPIALTKTPAKSWPEVAYSEERAISVPGHTLTVTVTVPGTVLYERHGLHLWMNMLVTALALILALLTIATMRNRRLVRLEQRQAETAIQSERKRAHTTLQSLADAVFTVNNDLALQYMNPVAERLTGWSATAAFGQNVFNMIEPLDEERTEPIPLTGSDPITVLQSLEGYAIRTPNGNQVSVDQTITKLTDRRGNDNGAVLVLRDVSRERELAKQLKYQATHDHLTGLLNRWEFEVRLNEILSARGARHALCYLDLDQFKLVNDTCGHLAGDEMLKQVSELLCAELRGGDLLARLGGDEFAIVLRNIQTDAAKAFADRIRKALKKSLFEWQGKVFDIAVSIGIVPLMDQALTVSEAQSMADLACYAAKTRGRNCVHVYVPGDANIERTKGDMNWHTRIKSALNEGRFCLFWQEIRRVAHIDQGPYMREFLLRMRAPDGRLVPPMAFIPAAERFGLIGQIDRWVVENAFRVIATFHTTEMGSMFTINLSAHSLQDEEMAAYIEILLGRMKVPPAKVCFEITETALISNLSAASSFIRSLKGLGCRFALDDFGSGLSSLEHLKRLPVDFLKIDGEFVKDIANDPVDLTVIKSIVEIGKALGIETVAEKAEDKKTWEMLKKIQVDYIQGYYIGRPEPVRPLQLIEGGSDILAARE